MVTMGLDLLWMKPEFAHRTQSRLQSNQSHSQLSGNLLSYVRSELQNSSIDYEESLQPLHKGYERLLYTFQLKNISGEFSKPLILRLFQKDISRDFILYESRIQSIISEFDFPVPRIVLECLDKSVLDGFFIIMERLPGLNLNDYIMINPYKIGQLSRIMARIQYHLHCLNADRVVEKLENSGIDTTKYSSNGMLNQLFDQMENNENGEFKKDFKWLTSHSSVIDEHKVICHSDLHFGNIIYNEKKVVGVIDWGNTRFAEPEFDVSSTILLLQRIFRNNFGLSSPIVNIFRRYLIWMYLSEYRRFHPINSSKLQYYQALICFSRIISLTNLHSDDPSIINLINFYNSQLKNYIHTN
jgi:aminoglycoside phosphotransferase (APT) family kinase protein